MQIVPLWVKSLYRSFIPTEQLSVHMIIQLDLFMNTRFFFVNSELLVKNRSHTNQSFLCNGRNAFQGIFRQNTPNFWPLHCELYQSTLLPRYALLFTVGPLIKWIGVVRFALLIVFGIFDKYSPQGWECVPLSHRKIRFVCHMLFK